MKQENYEGRQAFKDGKPETANPYENGSWRAREWHRGWNMRPKSIARYEMSKKLNTCRNCQMWEPRTNNVGFCVGNIDREQHPITNNGFESDPKTLARASCERFLRKSGS